MKFSKSRNPERENSNYRNKSCLQIQRSPRCCKENCYCADVFQFSDNKSKLRVCVAFRDHLYTKYFKFNKCDVQLKK